MSTEKMELRYQDLKNAICADIYEGTYQNGGRIPSERQLAIDYNISRITVRKALELLEEDGLIRREVGNGTTVQYHNWGNKTPLDMFALVAPSKNPFFSGFIAEFQKIAWEHDALLLYVEIPVDTSLEDCLYRLYQKNIRNAIIWSDDQIVDEQKLLRLRSIGMNFVFFDTDDGYPYGDCVYLDNVHAIKQLLTRPQKKYENYLYVGWDKLEIRNIKKRGEIFQTFCPTGELIRLPWKRNRKMDEKDLKKIAEKIQHINYKKSLLFCEDGEIGKQLTEYLYDQKQLKISIVVIDDFEGAEKYPIAIYQQNLKKTAQVLYEKMKEQSINGKAWKAEIITIKGTYFENVNIL